jgi:hypothetical protein
MNQKELGKTGVLLPEIGLGTWQYCGGVEPIKKAIVLAPIFRHLSKKSSEAF